MALKRKSAPNAEEQPKSKTLKTRVDADKSTQSPSKKPRRSHVEVSEESSEEEEIEEAEEIASEEESDAEEESENGSDVLDAISEDEYDDMSDDGEDENDALDNEEEEEEEDAMDVNDAAKKSKPKSAKSTNSEVSVKEVPAHAAQRALAKERKLSRPNGATSSRFDLMVANTIQEAKRIWETLRLQKQSKADRQKQVNELFTLISGDIPNLVFGHSASRFVQAAVKYGSPDQRLAIAKELKGRYIELSKAKYGKFLVGKILEYGNADVRILVVKEFLGNVNKLITHNEAGAVLNDIYRDIATPSQRIEILQEIYGPEFRLFKSEKGMSLQQILKEKPEKKELISKNLIELVKNCMKKDIINLDLVHTALLQALQISSHKDIEELVSLFKEQLHQLVHTKDGAHAACLLISYGTAKDRKAMIKSIREIIPQMSTDQYGHTVLIILCAVVDDTKLISKAVLAELKDTWHDLICHKWGRNLVLSLCREDKSELLKECREKSIATSKKDIALRREELLDVVSETFLDIVSELADHLMRDPLESQVVQEILLHARGKKDGAIQAVVDLAARHPSNANHIIKLSFTARIFKTLVQGGHYNVKEKKVDVVDDSRLFASGLWSAVQPNLSAWATGEGSFVVVALVETFDKGENYIFEALELQYRALKEKAPSNKGTKLLLEKVLARADIADLEDPFGQRAELAKTAAEDSE